MESLKHKMTDNPAHRVEISRSVEPLDEEPDEPSIIADVVHVLESLEQPVSEVSVRLVAEAEIASLNSEYRGRDGATNVLSFPATLQLEDVRMLGDIVICTPLACMEARSFDKPCADRFRHLLVHGVLHLLGYDHQAEEERKAMEELEISLLAGLGVENPYE